MASKVTPKEKLVGGNKTLKKGGKFGKGGGSAAGMQQSEKAGAKSPLSGKGGKK
jgi:hypothetical protein